MLWKLKKVHEKITREIASKTAEMDWVFLILLTVVENHQELLACYLAWSIFCFHMITLLNVKNRF